MQSPPSLERVPSLDYVVVKIGGSLLSLSDWEQRLDELLGSLQRHRLVVVSGGGPLADVVRHWDQFHSLGEHVAHDLAIRTMSITARLLAARLPSLLVVDAVELLDRAWNQGRVPVFDAARMLLDNPHNGPARGTGSTASLKHTRPDLPCTWAVTSDSIAAWLASYLGADRLILVKSIPVPVEGTAAGAARAGDVDLHFPSICAGLMVDWVNLRAQPLAVLPWLTPGHQPEIINQPWN